MCQALRAKLLAPRAGTRGQLKREVSGHMVWWLFWWLVMPLRWLGMRANRRRYGWGHHHHHGGFGGYGGYGGRCYGGRWRGW